MILYVLVIWFGAGNAQTTFAVPGIATRAECVRLGRQLRAAYGGLTEQSAQCFPYKAGPTP